MRFFLLASAFIWIAVQPGYGQDGADSLDTGLERGSWSLQFQIYQPVVTINGRTFVRGGTSILNEFDGGFVSAKFHLSDHSAIRGSVGFTRIDEFIDFRSFTRTMDPDTGMTERGFRGDRERLDVWTADVSILFLRYVEPAPSFAFYFGAGPGFMMNLDDDTRSIFRSPLGSDELFTDTFNGGIDDMWGTGVHFVIGAEWFVTSNISLIGEYHSQLFYREFDIIIDREFEDQFRFQQSLSTESTKGVFFEPQPVRFGLSVYF